MFIAVSLFQSIYLSFYQSIYNTRKFLSKVSFSIYIMSRLLSYYYYLSFSMFIFIFRYIYINLYIFLFIYRVFIKYCVFFENLKIFPDSGLSWFFLGVYTRLDAWSTKWQVEHQRCSRTGRVKKNHNILRKKHNT